LGLLLFYADGTPALPVAGMTPAPTEGCNYLRNKQVFFIDVSGNMEIIGTCWDLP